MSPSRRRYAERDVVVTGMGVISPYGQGRAAYWRGLASGRCALGPLTLFPTEGFASNIGGQVDDATARSLGTGVRSRANRFVSAAAREAVRGAGLSPAQLRDAALSIGGAGGGMLEAEAWYEHYFRGEENPRGRGALRAMLPAAQTQVVATRLRIEGPRETPILACSSSAAAIATVADLIAAGVADVGLAGGVDSLTRICFMGFNALKLLDKQPCRPFSKDRQGMSISEGAAVLVLESHRRRRARTARRMATATTATSV